MVDKTTYEVNSPEYYMTYALEQAKKAAQIGEVPIGAVAVYQDKIVGYGYNLRETTQDATTHAEMQAIRMANQTLGNWRLMDVDLYVTLEPCAMCSGAIVLSRIRHLYYGATDVKGGACGTLWNLVQDDRLNHHVLLTSGVLEVECREILQKFFQELRQKRKGNSRKPKN